MAASSAVATGAGLKCALFDGLTPRDRDAILAASTTRRFPANSVITKQGYAADRLLLLVKGSVRNFYTTSEGKKILLFWMSPGEAFGGLALASKPFPYMVSAEAVRDCEVLVWERSTFRAFVAKFPVLLDNAILLAATYVDHCVAAQVALSCHSARERLGSTLREFAVATGEKMRDGILVDVTNEELANSAHITKFTTSRILAEWQKSRLLTKRRGKILVPSLDRLPIGQR